MWDHLLENALASVNNRDTIELDLNYISYSSDMAARVLGSLRRIMLKELWQIKEFSHRPTSISFYF
jgi:hypothetical protein